MGMGISRVYARDESIKPYDQCGIPLDNDDVALPNNTFRVVVLKNFHGNNTYVEFDQGLRPDECGNGSNTKQSSSFRCPPGHLRGRIGIVTDNNPVIARFCLRET